jgi:hypothetical protein
MTSSLSLLREPRNRPAGLRLGSAIELTHPLRSIRWTRWTEPPIFTLADAILLPASRSRSALLPEGFSMQNFAARAFLLALFLALIAAALVLWWWL